MIILGMLDIRHLQSIAEAVVILALLPLDVWAEATLEKHAPERVSAALARGKLIPTSRKMWWLVRILPWLALAAAIVVLNQPAGGLIGVLGLALSTARSGFRLMKLRRSKTRVPAGARS